MPDCAATLVERIHATKSAGVFYVTGGGSYLLPMLLTVPGASATVLEAQVPYANEALSELLGSAPDQACSDETARALAMCAFQRARHLGGSFGLGLTASLRSAAPKRGDHRFHIAIQTPHETYSISHTLTKGAATREEEETTTAIAALDSLAFVLGLSGEPTLDAKPLTVIRLAPDGEITPLLGAEPRVVGQATSAILPGAFNPLHEGHRVMRRIAEGILGEPVVYELCVANLDKPPLDFIEIERRKGQFNADELVLTNTPTFIEKARVLASGGPTTFIVGADTIVRIGQAHYYASAAARDRAIDEMAELECNFLVFGRLRNDRFETLASLELPDALRRLSTDVPETVFRRDISSTALRASKTDGS